MYVYEYTMFMVVYAATGINAKVMRILAWLKINDFGLEQK